MAHRHSAILAAAFFAISNGAMVSGAQADPFGFFTQPQHVVRTSPRPRRDPVPEAPLPVPIPRPKLDSSDIAMPSAPTAAPTPPKKVVPNPPSPAILPSDHPAAAAPVPNTVRPKAAEPQPAPAKTPNQPAPTLPSAASGPVRQPIADPSCLVRLKTTHVVAETITIGPQPDERCTVVDPVKLTALELADGSSVVFPDAPTLACVTADTFAAYVRELLYPLSKGSYGVPVAKVWTGPGLECRSRDHVFGAKLSAHGQGLAVDIAQMALRDGRLIAVGPPKTEVDRAFETAARAAGCGYFHTALGPGSDAYHATHWHFDLEPRGGKGDGRYCQ